MVSPYQIQWNTAQLAIKNEVDYTEVQRWPEYIMTKNSRKEVQ